MKFVRSKLCMIALLASAILAASIRPDVLFAQTSGVGGDGDTRLLWRATDGSISLWKLDANLNQVAVHIYGPYLGWIPKAITVGNNSYSYVLWKYTDGTAEIWLVDPNLNYVANATYGPVAAWTGESLSTDASATNLRLIWRSTYGAVSIWSLDQNLNVLREAEYGPYFGYDPGPATEAVVKSPRSALKMPATGPTRSDTDRHAASAMGRHRSAKIFPMFRKR